MGTVCRWDAERRITARRLPAARGCFDDSDVRKVLRSSLDAGRWRFVVCRVSSPGQEADLAWQVQEALSPQRELVWDLPAIVHTLSGRLYGLRCCEKEAGGADLMTGGDR